MADGRGEHPLGRELDPARVLAARLWQRQRHELRSRLLWAGFGPLQGGLWVGSSHADVAAVTAGLDLDGHLRVFAQRACRRLDVDSNT